MKFHNSPSLPVVALACAFSLAASAQPAAAFELFGVCLFGECETAVDDDAGFIDPRRYALDFQINETAPDKVRDAIKGSSQLWVGRDQAVAGSAGLIARTKGDYRRILAALYDSGYFGGTISITVDGVQAADLPAFRDLPQTANVSVNVETGPEYRFGQADIENRAPPTLDPDDLPDKTLEDVGYSIGEGAKASAVRNAGELAVEEWRQQGYAKAEIAEKNATALHPKQILNVLLRMTPGQRARYGNISVEGTDRMNPEFVAYMTGLLAGDEYDPDDIERALKRLDRLGVFSSRKIEEADEINADGLLPLNIIVRERKLRRIGLGATLSSVDGAGLEGYWLHRNLFGQAESLRLDAKVGGIGSTVEAQEFDYLLSATYTTPGIYSPDTDLVANVYARQEFNETFDNQSAGGSLTLKNYWSDRLTLEGGVFANYGQYDDAFGERTFFTSGLVGNAVYDGRDNKLDPTEGYYFSLDAKPFYEWEFGNAAARFEGEARAYVDFGSDGRSVVAGRLKLGSIVGPSLREIPSDLLFTAGGGNSVRGYSFKSIGVEQANGETSGGASLIETSLEFRRRISESFGAVAFVDAGTVGSDPLSGFDDDLKVGVGVGVRYFTGLGPIRLDVALPLDPGDDDAGFAIYAGIGQAF